MAIRCYIQNFKTLSSFWGGTGWFESNNLVANLPRQVLSWLGTFEPPHDKTNKMACVPNEDSDQPGHPPSLISVFAVCMKKHWILSYPLSAQQRLRSDRVDAQADLSRCWVSHDTHFMLSNKARCSMQYLGLQLRYEPHHKKTCLWGFRPGMTQTGLLSYRDS